MAQIGTTNCFDSKSWHHHLAAANPVELKYNVDLPIAQNIDLPPTLISHSDLLYLVLDRIDKTLGRKLAQHLVGLYLGGAPDTGGHDILVGSI